MIPLLAFDAIGTLEDGLRITHADARMPAQSAKQIENNESCVGRRLPRAVVARRLAKAPIFRGKPLRSRLRGQIVLSAPSGNRLYTCATHSARHLVD
jgi:hypothetical protein